MKVFLGGTCNESTWREILISMLKIDYFNPVVDNWDEEAQKNEMIEKENANYCLYVITPLMSGVYSIAEVVDDSNKRPEKTILCILNNDYNEKDKEHVERCKRMFDFPEGDNLSLQDLLDMNCHGYTWSDERRHSLQAVKRLVESNGVKVFSDLEDVADYLNKD